MSRFRDLPIRRKLLLLTLTSTGTALVFAAGGFLLWDIFQLRADIRQDVTAETALLADNSAAPLTFRDDRVASEILAVLRIRPHVEVGCVYDSTGAVFTSYRRDPESTCPVAVPQNPNFGWQALEVVAPIAIDGRAIGTLYVRRDLADMIDRLGVGSAMVLGLLLLAIGTAFLTGTRLQREIATPMLELADTARAISATRNYSLRATPSSDDELGVVMRAFNEMLDRMAEALERERGANRLKDEFLATLSHELRTPLTGVLGWTRLLRSGRLDPAAQQQALETIERNARAQARLVDDLLDMSRITSGKPSFHVDNADLAAIVDAAVDVVRPAAAAKHLQVLVEIGERPAMTQGDSGRLQQIVWNLLSNAVKFTPAGGRVWVTLAREDGYCLSIRDSGPGIDPKFLPFVFEPFRQGDGSHTRQHGGLGLGLAIAKQLVELHGGTIRAYSPTSGGATFEVRLPSIAAAAADGATPAEVLPAPAVQRALLRGLRVLVVDDEDDARILLQTSLTQYGAQVTTASSVPEALAAIDRQPPDVLLSDIGMPNEDGYSLIQQVRKRGAARGGSIPAVAVTAYASVKDGLAAETAGFQAHIAKPFEPADVANLVALLGNASRSGL